MSCGRLANDSGVRSASCSPDSYEVRQAMTSDEARHLRHELRTPVNHLIGYADLLLDDEALPAKIRMHLAEVRSLARQVNSAIPGVLDDNDATSRRSVEALHLLAGDLEDCMTVLQADATEAIAADIERLASATRRLREMVDHLRGSDAESASVTPTDPAAQGMTAPPMPLGTILVVDDDEANREVLVRRLVRLGYAAREATNGREALNLLRSAPIDLALVDVMMPQMDGYTLLEHRRADAALRDIPVIMISALDQMESVIRCIEAGAEDYLPKPFDPVLLQARISACLEKKRLHDSEKSLLATVSKQAEELKAWNHELEERVAEKVREVERLQLLRRFLAPQLAEVILNEGEALLESHRREITVLFCDLRGFTAFAETSEPEDLMAVLREFHEAVGPLIFKYQGTLERFTGDGMMVFFNDPIPCDEPAWCAVQLALEMRSTAASLGEEWHRRGHQLELGIGISIGYATCGRIGFEGRYDYGAIGTVTNVAARLCAEAKGGQILIGQRVLAMVEGRVEAESVGELAFKNLSRPLATYSLLAKRAPHE